MCCQFLSVLVPASFSLGDRENVIFINVVWRVPLWMRALARKSSRQLRLRPQTEHVSVLVNTLGSRTYHHQLWWHSDCRPPEASADDSTSRKRGCTRRLLGVWVGVNAGIGTRPVKFLYIFPDIHFIYLSWYSTWIYQERYLSPSPFKERRTPRHQRDCLWVGVWVGIVWVGLWEYHGAS